MSWTKKNEPFLLTSAFQDWSRTLTAQEQTEAQRKVPQSFIEPVVLKLIVGEVFKTIEEARNWLERAVLERKFLMDPFEREVLTTRIERAQKYDMERPISNSEGVVEIYTLYNLIDDLLVGGIDKEELKGRAEILEIGPAIPFSPGKVQRDGRQIEPVTAPRRAAIGNRKTPIVAVIDDGIGFLNNRFRTGPVEPWGATKTRFHAVWLQAMDTIAIPQFGSFYVYSGQVLHADEIDDNMLSLGAALDEEAVYRRLNEQVVKPGRHRSTEYSFTHGTHILDVAAGADPGKGEVAEDWPLLAVQLPSEAVDNTAGTQLEPSIIQGVRWILAQAEMINDESPVIINVSFGTMAGPKDGTKAIEYLITRQLEEWQTDTGRCARVIFSNGNARLRRQVARCKVDPMKAQDLTWRLQPDDHSACFAEIRPDDADQLTDLKIGLTSPSGTVLTPVALPPRTFRQFTDEQGRAIARLYHVPELPLNNAETTPAYYLFATAPTADGMTARIENGGWSIRIINDGDSGPIVLRAEIQRGETPIGYRLNGRQSYFDDPEAFGWEVEVQDYSVPQPPITREGTHSSFTTAVKRSQLVACVGAAQGPSLKAARYSGEGSSWTVDGPNVAAVADDAPGGRGVIAAGTYSGSTRQLNGSSVAAAKVTHCFARLFSEIDCTPSNQHMMADEIDAILARFGEPPTAGEPVSQLGQGVITEPGGARTR